MTQADPQGGQDQNLGPAPHQEGVAQRNDRNLSDLLQELRVAGLGVQVLFGFLLSLPFTVGFKRTNTFERDLYKASLLMAALSIVLLVAPVAHHRWVFRRHEKGRLLRTANVLALMGLGSVAVAVSASVLMVLSLVGTEWQIALFESLIVGAFTFLWFVMPVHDRFRHAHRTR